jgi:hypothetical protein
MSDTTRRQERRKLELRRERLRVLDARDLDHVAGAQKLGRVCTRYCITTGGEL